MQFYNILMTGLSLITAVISQEELDFTEVPFKI